MDNNGTTAYQQLTSSWTTAWITTRHQLENSCITWVDECFGRSTNNTATRQQVDNSWTTTEQHLDNCTAVIQQLLTLLLRHLSHQELQLPLISTKRSYITSRFAIFEIISTLMLTPLLHCVPIELIGLPFLF